MRRIKGLKPEPSSWLPEEFWDGHRLCFRLHDLMVNTLVYGERAGVFTTRLELEGEEEATTLEATQDVLAWMEQRRSKEERLEVLIKAVFPAILSDLLSFLYEALATSRKAKLGVTYALLRKPIQEGLFILEAVLLDDEGFADTFAAEPLKLRAGRQGGIEAHSKRIQAVLDATSMNAYFSAAYLAQLRYSKAEDFDGICNHAVHLFTEHEAIRTEPLNMNFIFSGWDEKMTQWAFLYTRLPYLLAYAHTVVDYVVERFARTTPEYKDATGRQTAALTLRWHESVPEDYRAAQIDRFVEATGGWLRSHCSQRGYRQPTRRDLKRMSETGAYPGQSWLSLKVADWRLMRQASAAERTYRRSGL
jgi:hypothetical protein